MERHGTNVWGGGGVKHAGVTVCPMATAGMQPPGKADIPQSSAVQLPGYKNNTSHDMHPIPEQERQKSSGNTLNTPSENSDEADQVRLFTCVACSLIKSIQ